MVKLGLPPARAILAATAWAAELLDRQKEVGTVQVGRYADLIAVPGDPLRDVRVLERVPFVMKGGAIVKDELTPTSAATAGSKSSSRERRSSAPSPGHPPSGSWLARRSRAGAATPTRSGRSASPRSS